MLSAEIRYTIKACTGYTRNVQFIRCVTLAVVFMTGDHVLSPSLSVRACVIQGGDRLKFYLALFLAGPVCFFLLLGFKSKSAIKLMKLHSSVLLHFLMQVFTFHSLHAELKLSAALT